MTFLLERAIFYVDDVTPGIGGTIDAMLEKRGKVEDKILLESYNELREKGTYWVTPERMKDRMGKLQFVPKAANIVGLQIADLIAYPIACHIILAAPASGRRFLKTPSVDQRICGGLLYSLRKKILE